jgi:ligand-binding sensor domain-containing protein
MERDRNLASGITLEVSGRAMPSRDSTGQEAILIPCWWITEGHSGLAQNDGVYRISGGVADHYGVSNGLSGNDAGLLFEDREGNIWVVTDGGLDMFRDTALISYTTRQGVSDSQFHSVMTLRNGAVWIGTRGALYILRKQDGKTAIFDRKLSGKAVGPMLEDHSGAVWLGSGLTLMRFQNGRSREIGGQRFASFGGVSGIAEDSGGTIWVLTPRGAVIQHCRGHN